MLEAMRKQGRPIDARMQRMADWMDGMEQQNDTGEVPALGISCRGSGASKQSPAVPGAVPCMATYRADGTEEWARLGAYSRRISKGLTVW